MTLKQTLKKLESLGNEKTRAHYARSGAGTNQYGVPLGEVRKLAKELKTNPELGLALWETGNIDARMLGILLLKPKDLAPAEVDRLVRTVTFSRVADWFIAYIVKKHPAKENLRQKWMTAADPMAARAGWALTAERVAKDRDGLDLAALLDRIEAEAGDAPEVVQWTLNFALVEIGIQSAKHRKRALAIGEALGLYRDYPAAKGCTSPFAPIWIKTMVARQS